MKLICPCCNTVFPVEAALMDAQAREAVSAALALPGALGDRLLRYLGLFRSPSRALAWDRVARLLHELLDAIKAGRVERNGRAWVAPMPAWEIALDDILDKRDKLQLPLRTHGYLFEIVAGMAAKSEGRKEAAELDSAKGPHRVLNKAEDAAPINPEVRALHLGTLKSLTGVKP